MNGHSQCYICYFSQASTTKMHLYYVIIAGLLGGGAFSHPTQPQIPPQSQAEAVEFLDRVFCIQDSADFRIVESSPMIERPAGVSQPTCL